MQYMFKYILPDMIYCSSNKILQLCILEFRHNTLSVAAYQHWVTTIITKLKDNFNLPQNSAGSNANVFVPFVCLINTNLKLSVLSFTF
jgi:hypothetical protein